MLVQRGFLLWPEAFFDFFPHMCAHLCRPQRLPCLLLQFLHVLEREAGEVIIVVTFAVTKQLFTVVSGSCGECFVWGHKTKERAACLGLVQKQVSYIQM